MFDASDDERGLDDVERLWPTFAELALFWAMAEAVGRKGRRRMRRRLMMVAEAWERPGTLRVLGAPRLMPEAQAERLAAARFIRPTLAMLERMYPKG